MEKIKNKKVLIGIGILTLILVVIVAVAVSKNNDSKKESERKTENESETTTIGEETTTSKPKESETTENLTEETTVNLREYYENIIEGCMIENSETITDNGVFLTAISGLEEVQVNIEGSFNKKELSESDYNDLNTMINDLIDLYNKRIEEVENATTTTAPPTTSTEVITQPITQTTTTLEQITTKEEETTSEELETIISTRPPIEELTTWYMPYLDNGRPDYISWYIDPNLSHTKEQEDSIYRIIEKDFKDNYWYFIDELGDTFAGEEYIVYDYLFDLGSFVPYVAVMLNDGTYNIYAVSGFTGDGEFSFHWNNPYPNII